MILTLAPTNPQDLDTTVNWTYPTVSISHPDDGLTVSELLNILIKPALIAWGFNQTTVARIVFDDDNTADPY